MNPTNIDNLERVGVYDPESFGQTIQAVREVSGACDVKLVDLHDLLPDAGFRDPAGHFSTDDEVDGPLLVARELVPVVLERAKRIADEL